MSKYPRTYHLSYSCSVTSDDKVGTDVSNLIGEEIIITEKLDGSNTGMTNDGVYGRSHVDFTSNPWDSQVRQIHDQKVRGTLSDGVYIFGENMEGIHSIEYSNLDYYFYIFGVRDNTIWIPWSEVEEYSFLLDIPTVPVLFKGKVNSEKELKDLVEDLVSKKSELGGEREGVVVRSAGLFHDDDFQYNVLKWVRKDHVTTDVHWTRNWRRARVK